MKRTSRLLIAELALAVALGQTGCAGDSAVPVAKAVLVGMAITMLLAVVAWLFFRRRGQKITATSDVPFAESVPDQGEPNT